jgi:hypothetical protein
MIQSFEEILDDCEILFEKKIDPTSISIFVGKLTTYAKEFAEYLGWFDTIPEVYFDATRFAEDLVKDHQVIKLNDPTNNVHDEDGIWILNPDDFDSECDDDNDIGDFDDMI